MVRQLQSRKASRTLHIALFLITMLLSAGSVSAQTILNPGDVAFVSVNAEDNTFEIVPLVNLEKETTLFFTNAAWQAGENGFSEDRSMMIVLKEEVEAGTVLRYNNQWLDSSWTDGHLRIDNDTEILYVYQLDTHSHQFITAVSWGNEEELKEKLKSLPALFAANEDLWIQLGSTPNNQYYLRNGASGTPAMLRSLLTSAANWRGQADQAFQPLSTSFSLMKPPVIMFDESTSSVMEGEGKATLNVAIYEHDGSKLTVDVVFDSVYSTLDKQAIRNFSSRRINFTGLIGDGVYEIEIPVTNNEDYDGIRTATFSLQNLSEGHLGDFVTHTMIIQDDELPALQPDLINAGAESFLVIHNLENAPVDLSGWTLTKGKEMVEFPKGMIIPSTRYMAIFESNSVFASSEPGLKLSLEEEMAGMLRNAGTIVIKDEAGNPVSELRIRSGREQEGALVVQTEERDQTNRDEDFTTDDTGDLSTGDPLTNVPVGVEGWKKLSPAEIDQLALNETEYFRWNPELLRFDIFNSLGAGEEENQALLSYLNKDQATELLILENETAKGKEVATEYKFTLSAADMDGNGSVDRLEGLNLEFNSSGQNLPYEWLVNAIGDDLNPRIYNWDLSNNQTRSVHEGDVVPAGGWFFVVLQQPLESRMIQFAPEDYSTLPTDTEVLNEPQGSFSLELSGQGFKKDIEVHFRSENADPVQPRTTLEGLSEIKLPGEAYAAFYLDNGNDWFETLELDTEPSNPATFDLGMIASRSGSYKLQTRNWDRVPQDWIVILEDKIEDREYILDKNWSFEFDYENGLDASQTFKLNEPPKPDLSDRFQITVMSRTEYFSREEVDLPQELDLHQNYPNPFNPVTTISFYLPNDAEVRLSIFNIVGQPVARLVDRTLSSGDHTIEWDASDMPSGMYIYQLEVGSRIMTRKMTLVK